jgi:beta-glucanase (GH16 family)
MLPVNSGHLTITLQKRTIRLVRHILPQEWLQKTKQVWLYGDVEVKAKLPKGRGTWPAIWMLPNRNVYGGWPTVVK